MNLISLLGLVGLLAIAWAMSYHRRDLPWRTIGWGLGLQFVLALIILREDWLSFLGMAVLAGLIIVYAVHETPELGSTAARTAASLAGIVAVSALVGWAAPGVIPWLVAFLVVVLIVRARLGAPVFVSRLAAALIIGLGVSWLIANQLDGQRVFKTFSDKVAGFLSLSDYGARFLFDDLGHPELGWPLGSTFAFRVLPTIIFFGGFMSVLYHLGIMQKVIVAMSRFMRWTVGTSGAETLSCSANIFVGQTEAPLLIKPFLLGMTRSELLTVMVGGFATIAGGVLAGYISFGVPAGHLVAASVMSAPAALVIGKIIFPEKEHSETAGDVELPEIEVGGNVIEAATNGITDGLKLAVNVGAMLIGFTALIAVIDVVLNYADSIIDGTLLGGTHVAYATTGLSPAVAEYAGIFPGSLQTLFGTVLRPLAWVMGVPWADAAEVGNLLGIKLSLNEFVAYGTLSTYIQSGAISERAIVIATYALCGFANFASIGIQIGGIAAIAPERKSELAELGLKAMFGGALASWTTATIAGVML